MYKSAVMVSGRCLFKILQNQNESQTMEQGAVPAGFLRSPRGAESSTTARTRLLVFFLKFDARNTTEPSGLRNLYVFR
jgi:hypothetical protein